MPRNAYAAASLMAIALLISACEDKGATPPPPSMAGDWIVTNVTSNVESLLELDHRGDNLSGFWHPGELSIRVTGHTTPSNEFTLTGQSNNRTYVFDAEANDGLSRFAGSLSVYDVRGDRVSLQMISGRR